jgi:hypothetical protein
MDVSRRCVADMAAAHVSPQGGNHGGHTRARPSKPARPHVPVTSFGRRARAALVWHTGCHAHGYVWGVP